MEVKKTGITESGLSLIDRQGNSYHWVTKQYNHELYFTDEFIKVRMTVEDGLWGNKVVRNVRIVKRG